MAAGIPPALGLSIGSTNLAVVTAENALTRKPVLTLYRQRPPEVGLPSENPRLDEPGVVITDFVDRVGDPADIVAADRSLHRSEALMADALRALAYAATDGGALPEHTAVTHPAHWGSAAVDALGTALSRVSEWSDRSRPLVLIPDASAALFAARTNPGIPAGGTVAVCDFGGSGTSITLMDAAGDYRALAPTVRYHDFSGNLIDQALVTAVMGNMPGTGSFDPSSTLASGSLGRLRAECRIAKEQLSTSTVTTLADELPGLHGDFRLTRNELEEVIRESLDNFMRMFEHLLALNVIRDLSAVVAVGGGANIPLVTTTLSGRLGVPVVTRQRPQLLPAIGAALRAARGPREAAATMANPAAPVVATVPVSRVGSRPPAGATVPAETLAWPQRNNPRNNLHAMPVASPDNTVARPAPQPEQAAPPDPEPTPEPTKPPWYRQLPVVAAIGLAVVFLLAGAAAAIALHTGNKPTTATPAAGTSPTAAPTRPPETPAPLAAAPASPAPKQDPPPPTTSDTNPPAQTELPTTTVPPATAQAEPPALAAPAAPRIRVPAIPALPAIPGVNEPIPGLDRVNQILQEFGVAPISR